MLLSVLNAVRKAANGTMKPYEIMKLDLYGNHNGHPDAGDVKIIGEKLVDELGLDDVVEKVADVAETIWDTVTSIF